MHSPATMPDTIKATPDTASVTSNRASHSTPTSDELTAQRIPAAATAGTSRVRTARAHAQPSRKPSPSKFSMTSSNNNSATASTKPNSRATCWSPNKWLFYAMENRERGMSTAEYAVGTIAACAFAALLFKVVSSPEVQEMLKTLIDRALKTNG